MALETVHQACSVRPWLLREHADYRHNAQAACQHLTTLLTEVIKNECLNTGTVSGPTWTVGGQPAPATARGYGQDAEPGSQRMSKVSLNRVLMRLLPNFNQDVLDNLSKEVQVSLAMTHILAAHRTH